MFPPWWTSPRAPRLDRAARDSLRRSRRWGGAMLGLGLVLFTAFLVVVNVRDDRAVELQRSGTRIPGFVTATCGCGDGGTVTAQYPFEHAVRSTKVRLGNDSPRYHLGERVVVLVDPHDSSHVTLRGEPNESPTTTLLLVALFTLGAVGLVIGTSGLVRVRRQRKLLEAATWSTVDVRWTAGPNRYRTARLAVADRGGHWHFARLGTASSWRLQSAGVRGAATVDVARGPSGRPSGRVILRVPGHDALVPVRILDTPVPADVLAVDATRVPPSASQLGRAVFVQLLAAVAFAILAVFAASNGRSVPTVLYGVGSVLLFFAAGATQARRRRLGR